jgi:uncharacterized protein (DUF2252 family)
MSPKTGTREGGPRRSRSQETHPPPEERARRGKAARVQAPRASHADFDVSPHRADPLNLLAQQSADRVPELVPLRWERMLESPFTFFRGAAVVMAADLASTPTSGVQVQACGDAHLSNFGVYGSPERRLVFDINDFDETLPAPWEWDLKRLAASLEIAARGNGFSVRGRRRTVMAAVARYRGSMRAFSGMGNLEVWYQRADTEDTALLAQFRPSVRDRRQLTKGLARARGKDSAHATGKLTEVRDGQRQFISNPPLVQPLRELMRDAQRAELESRLQTLIRGYRRTLPADRQLLLDQFRYVDIARNIVGVGSVGTRCWVVLLLGRDDDDPLLLQVKEATASVLARHAGESVYANEGQRVVAGQRLMQAVSDILLGWQRAPDIDGSPRDFYVRQLRDWKGSVDVAAMPPETIRSYGELCGWTLARAHARSADRIAIAAYLGATDKFDNAVADFAAAYADQNERDHAQLVAAVRAGQLSVERGDHD